MLCSSLWCCLLLILAQVFAYLCIWSGPRLGIAHTFFQIFLKFQSLLLLGICWALSVCSGDLGLTAISHSSFWEAQDLTMLLRVGEGGAKETGVHYILLSPAPSLKSSNPLRLVFLFNLKKKKNYFQRSGKSFTKNPYIYFPDCLHFTFYHTWSFFSLFCLYTYTQRYVCKFCFEILTLNTSLCIYENQEHSVT